MIPVISAINLLHLLHDGRPHLTLYHPSTLSELPFRSPSSPGITELVENDVFNFDTEDIYLLRTGNPTAAVFELPIECKRRGIFPGCSPSRRA